MPNNMNKYGFGNNQDTDNRDWYPTKQEPIKTKLHPYNHIDDLINEKLEQHIQRTDNPHQVTLQQLGVDHLFTHNMRVEYDEEKPVIHLILLDLNGNPLSDVGPIDIDVSEYSEEQLEELKRYLEERIHVVEEEVKEIIDNLSIEELSKRKVIKVYQEEIDDRWILAETFNPLIVYYEKLIEEDKTYYRRIILDEETFVPNTYYYYKETGINQEQPTTRNLLRANTLITNTEVEKEEDYYPAYEYNENEKYYELVYDVNPNIVRGIWHFNDVLEPALYGGPSREDVPYTAWTSIHEDGSYTWYSADGRKHENVKAIIIADDWMKSMSSRYAFYRYQDGGHYYEWSVPVMLGFAFCETATWQNTGGLWNNAYRYGKDDILTWLNQEDIYDVKGQWTPEYLQHWYSMFINHGSDPKWDDEGMKKVWIEWSNNDSFISYLKSNAYKISDELLPYGDNNYKTKYVEVEVTPENFEPGKYYTYYQTPKEAEEVTTQRMLLSKTFKPDTNYYAINSIDPVSNKPIYKQVILTEQEFYDNYRTDYYKILIQEDRVEEDEIVRIQLDPKESIYRDYDGNDVLKIVDNNVLINGDPLYPNLTVNSDTYIDKVLETNAEEVYDNKLNGLKLTIPLSAKHGFCSYISFEPNSSFTFNVVNRSIYSLKVIMSGAKTTLSDLVFSEGCQYNLMFLCNGVNVELYIQEILLG